MKTSFLMRLRVGDPINERFQPFRAKVSRGVRASEMHVEYNEMQKITRTTGY